MAIHKIEEVKINGKNQAFGGYIYAVDMSVGLTDGPTRITIKFVNESGTFFEPELSTTKTYRIQIGNVVNENYYAIEYGFNKTSQGRDLEVIFVDGSIILDKIFVGLHKRHGDENTNIDGLLIVGREIHPCDVNDDGVFDQKDALELQWQDNDPCELRCPSDPNSRQPIIESCLDREITEVFDVKYSFRDLMNALQGNVQKLPARAPVTYPVPLDLAAGTTNVTVSLPTIAVNPNINRFNRVKINNVPSNLNDAYLSSYTGSLRDVLKSWCADFGWSFFWEKDSLNFIDTSARPKINTAGFANLESLSERKTLEGTVARGFISRYIEPGIIAQTDCEQSQAYLLRCLTLGDLYGNRYKPAWKVATVQQADAYSSSASTRLDPPVHDPTDANEVDNQIEYVDDIFPEGVKISDFEQSCVFANYSDTLRHLYNLWEYYGIKTPQDAENKQGRWLDRMGQMRILRVYHSAASPALKDKYEKLISSSWGSSSRKLLSDEDVVQMNSQKGYLVLVQRNRKQNDEIDLLDKQFAVEEHLATNFMGRHWYRAYAAPFIGEAPQITPNGQYFGALSTNIKDLPFANFNHTYKSPIGKMVSSFVQRQRNDFRQYGRLKFAQDYSKNISNKLVRSILYMQKECSECWGPLKNTETAFNTLLTELDKKMFRKIDISDFTDADLKTLCKDESGNALLKDELLKNVELYMFFPGALNLKNDFVENPNEENPIHLEGMESFSLATGGLLNKKCVRYFVNGVPIYTPAGASVEFHQQYSFRWQYRDADVIDFQNPSYKIYVSNSVKNRGIIQKSESIYINEPNLNNTLRTDFQTKELTRDSTKFLNKLTATCSVSPEQIQEMHEVFSKNLSYSVNEPFASRKYKIFGITIPSGISIKSGLESVSVTIDGDGGVFTEISVGNSLFTPPEPNYILRLMELGIDVRALNSRKNPL